MAHNAFKLGRRSLIAGTGAMIATGTTGLWAWNRSDHTPLTDVPPGWYLLSRSGSNDGERQLVVRHNQRVVEHVLEIEFGTRFLSAAISPDARTLALLKRVPRGSMPTDAVALYNIQTFQRISVVEMQIAFQRIPTFNIGWSADGVHLTVSYDLAERTLLFRVNRDRKLSLQSMLEHASFQFHPTRADIALYTATPPAPSQVNVVQLMSDNHEQPIETFAGMDPQWSTDGTKLAYLDALGPNGTQRLIIRDESTKQAKALLVEAERLAWSPDSRRLAIYGLVHTDPLSIRQLLPANILPNWQLSTNQPRLLIYDTTSANLRSVDPLRKGFQLAHLQWLNPDWLLTIDVQAKQSFMIDRRGEQRLLVTELDDYTPLLRWIPQS